MEKKNTVLLTVIAVATLLVAVVGATFAYFTASSSGTGAGNSATLTTTNTGSVSLLMSDVRTDGNIGYPGGIMVNEAEVRATVTGNGNFTTTYKVTVNVDASALSNVSTVKYTLYASDTKIDTALFSSCTLVPESVGTETRYSYTGCTANLPGTKTTVIAEQTLTGGQTSATAGKVNESDTVTFTNLSSAAAQNKYFYLVVNYENNESASQNADQAQSITAQISGISSVNSVSADQNAS